MAINKETSSRFADKAWKIVTTAIVGGTFLFTAHEHIQRVHADNGLNQKIQSQGDQLNQMEADRSTTENVLCWTAGQGYKLEIILGNIANPDQARSVPSGPVPSDFCETVLYPEINNIYDGSGSTPTTPEPGSIEGIRN